MNFILKMLSGRMVKAIAETLMDQADAVVAKLEKVAGQTKNPYDDLLVHSVKEFLADLRGLVEK